ncbi:hypothetical protein HOY82DRAFT_240252 [Tuber indicum]|nr:hypothetical protein HOY82DRAFT_240252 [Tuber indicum]
MRFCGGIIRLATVCLFCFVCWFGKACGWYVPWSLGKCPGVLTQLPDLSSRSVRLHRLQVECLSASFNLQLSFVGVLTACWVTIVLFFPSSFTSMEARSILSRELQVLGGFASWSGRERVPRGVLPQPSSEPFAYILRV